MTRLAKDEFAEDEELGILLARDDPRALTLLMGKANRLEAILKRRFGGYILSEDLEDIVQDTLITAYNKRKDYKPELSRVMTWLTMLGHYTALRFLRKSGLFSVTNIDSLAETLATSGFEQTRLNEVEKPSKELEKLIQQLPLKQAKIIYMRYYDNLSFEEIAETLDTTPDAVRVSLHRARNKLRKLMEVNS